MNIARRFPGGKTKALTMSYDDGLEEDKRLVDIMNRYGIRGTFNLNSGALGRFGMVKPAEVAGLYAGHEVAVHTVRHPHLPQLATEAIAAEIRDDQKALEDLVGYPVRGMAYPYGEYDDRVAAILPTLGMEYGRTTRYNRWFDLPGDWYRWGGTCFHFDQLLDLAHRFRTLKVGRQPALMLVYGHSWEFSQDNQWDLIEAFAAQTGNAKDVWYATNIEVAEYGKALQALRVPVGSPIVENPSPMTVWLDVDGKTVAVRGGGKVTMKTGRNASPERPGGGSGG